MAVFNDMIVTNSGKVQYAKAMSGKKITFNRVGFGDSKPTGSVEGLTGLVHERKTGSIESIDTTTTEGVAIITVQVNNAGMNENIGIKEVGIFCLDPDTNAEVMYAYAYSENDIDVIPAEGTQAVVWKMRVQLEISNATGTPTQQDNLMSFTPVVTATPADGTTTVLTEVLATGKYTSFDKQTTAFYSITGKLSAMSTVGLRALTISLPQKSSAAYSVQAPMTVVTAENTELLVDFSGSIAKDGLVIEVDYFGINNGNFTLNFEVTYVEG